MNRNQFVKHLRQLNREELEEEILLLYDKIPDIKEFYKMEMGSDADRKKVYDKYKKEIQSCFKTKSYRKPRRPRIKKTKAILKEARSKSIFDHELADLVLHTAEEAIYFHVEYGFYSETLINNIISWFDEAITLISRSMTEELFETRRTDIVQNRGIPFELRKELIERNEKFN